MNKHHITHAEILNRCLWLNTGAIGFSLVHVMGEAIAVLPRAVSISIIAPLAGFVYAWWGLSMARTSRDGKSGVVSLFLLSVLWAGANGASIVYCLPPCGGLNPYNPLGDIVHLGSLLFAVLAGLATWQVIRTKDGVYRNILPNK